MKARVAEVWRPERGLAAAFAVCVFYIFAGAGPALPQAAQNPFQGSVAGQPVVPGVLPLSLDEAIRMGLKYNLGPLLASDDARVASGQRLQALQTLLPVVNGSATEAAQQTDLQAEGLRIPGFPAILGPYGYTDIRASAQWTANLSSLQKYLASKRDFAASDLSLEDAKDMVVLTVGNAYMISIADQARIQSAQAEVSSAEVSLNQANANHNAGTAPLLDVLRARVDYQTEQQNLIVAENQYAKDRIALARAIGLSLEQKFQLTDQAPFAALDHLDANTAVQQALATRKDLRSLEQQVEAAKDTRSAATAERYPAIAASADIGDIGPTLGNSHGTFDAAATASVPVFDEAKLRGDARVAQAQLDEEQAQLSDLRGQISADVRDNILDIQSAAKQVEVAGNNAQLAKEALREAQLRYAAGVSDNLAVSQAQTSMAQADEQYISSLYRHNLAKLSLARALGVAQTSYRNYLGGK